MTARTSEDRALQAWDVADVEFDADGTFEEKALALLHFAVLAPSGHNTQPWRFLIRQGSVDFFADRSRRLEVVDPDDRELVMSVGAAVSTFCVAAHHFGQATLVEAFPEPDDLDLVASVRLRPAEAYDHDLFAAIPTRRTTRAPFGKRDLPNELLRELKVDAKAQGVDLAIVAGDRRAAIAQLVSRGDAIQMSEQSFRRELASWVRPNTRDDTDGMRGYGFGFSNLLSHAGPFVIRAFDLGGSQGAKDRRLAGGAPALVLLATQDETPTEWLAAGQALVRVLLRLAAAGATASFLNQPIEVAELRGQLAAAVGISGLPQLLLRCGYGPEVKAEPRRPIEEVLSEHRRSTS
jgi:nitroreductase